MIGGVYRIGAEGTEPTVDFTEIGRRFGEGLATTAVAPKLWEYQLQSPENRRRVAEVTYKIYSSLPEGKRRVLEQAPGFPVVKQLWDEFGFSVPGAPPTAPPPVELDLTKAETAYRLAQASKAATEATRTKKLLPIEKQLKRAQVGKERAVTEAYLAGAEETKQLLPVVKKLREAETILKRIEAEGRERTLPLEEALTQARTKRILAEAEKLIPSQAEYYSTKSLIDVLGAVGPKEAPEKSFKDIWDRYNKLQESFLETFNPLKVTEADRPIRLSAYLVDSLSLVKATAKSPEYQGSPVPKQLAAGVLYQIANPSVLPYVAVNPLNRSRIEELLNTALDLGVPAQDLLPAIRSLSTRFKVTASKDRKRLVLEPLPEPKQTGWPLEEVYNPNRRKGTLEMIYETEDLW